MNRADESRLRLDLVSPLPPVRSGIADYTADLLPELARIADVRVLRLRDQPVADDLVATWQPEDATTVGSEGRLPLYQMGNNPWHEHVNELALATAGVLTLHDVYLHHLLMELTLARGEIDPYRERLIHDHGWIGAAVAEPPRWGAYGDAPLFALPCHRTLLERQRGILVHSQWALRLLQETLPEVAVRQIPMPMPLGVEPESSNSSAVRTRWGIPQDALLLGSFGFQTPIKRTDVVVRALARHELRNAHLLIVGEVAEQLDLAALSHEAGVADRVHVAGFVSRQELDASMLAVDLCVNLRYPTAGETSASLLRLFAQGRAAIVSDYAQFSEISDSATIKVPLGEDEVDALAASVGALAGDRQRLAEMGQAARQLIRSKHDPGKAAVAVVEACLELADIEPCEPRPSRPAPPTTFSWSQLPGTIEVDGLDSSWLPGTRRTLAIRLRNQGTGRWLAGHRGVGGIALEIRLESADGDVFGGRPWPGLPIDVPAGAEVTVEVEIRRPLGDCRLFIEPHVLGIRGFASLGGPTFEAAA